MIAAVAVAAAVPFASPMARNAMAQDGAAANDKLASLSPEQRRTYEAWRLARTAFETELDAYWVAVNAKRDLRKRKRTAGKPFTVADYVMTQPPKYNGPALPEAIAKLLVEEKPTVPETPRPTVGDFLMAAKEIYNFTPEVTTEEDFKRRYAAEALAIGLSKDQVVKVYALETGGNGTYDMQAGIHPQKRTGKAISSALGYAQLLHGNSVNELVKHGDGFVATSRCDGAVREGQYAVAGAIPAQQGGRRARNVARGTFGAERLERAGQARRHAEGDGYPCPQPRRRHRPVAAGDQAAGSEGGGCARSRTHGAQRPGDRADEPRRPPHWASR